MMINTLLETVRSRFALTALEPGEFETLPLGPMTFHPRHFRAEGFGHIGITEAFDASGAMKTQTVILTPEAKDLPLFSYDRIQMPGSDILIVELYNTTLTPGFDAAALAAVKERAAAFEPFPLEARWYDSLQLAESFSVKGSADVTDAVDTLAYDAFAAYLAAFDTAPDCDRNEKLACCDAYVQGLLDNGGAATDGYLKVYGYEKTSALFKKVMFGTEA